MRLILAWDSKAFKQFEDACKAYKDDSFEILIINLFSYTPAT